MKASAERSLMWAFAAVLVFVAAMMLSTCAKAATHHRHHRHHHYYHHRHHRTTTRATTTGSRHGSRYYHRRYASTQTRRHRNRSTPRVMAAAMGELTTPSGSSSRLVSAMRSHLGGNPTGWSHNWCAHYLDMELRATGHRGGGNLARGYARYGRPCGPQPGAIAVMPHHVGVVMSVGPGYVTLISGNHGHRVGIGRYSRSRIIAYRMPA